MLEVPCPSVHGLVHYQILAEQLIAVLHDLVDVVLSLLSLNRNEAAVYCLILRPRSISLKD